MPHFPQLKNKVLLSIGKFCDSGLHATFTIKQLFIYDAGTLYLRGRHNTTNGLWHIDLAHQRIKPLKHDLCNILLSTAAPPSPPAVSNIVYSLEKNETLSLTFTGHVSAPYLVPRSRQYMPDFLAHGPALPANLFAHISLNHWPRPKYTCAPPAPTNTPPKPPPFFHNLINHTTK